MEKEIWKDIIGYENLYQVSNYGNVKSLKFDKERILKQGINKGYCLVVLCEEGKQKGYNVHRLVAQAFLPNPDNLPCVNHKDENKMNNCASNLEWCTYQYNNSYGTKPERIGKAISIVQKGKIVSQETKEKISKTISIVRQKPILQFNREGTKIIGKWDSALQASNILKIDRCSICKCCKGKLKSCGGYKWKYLEEYV